MAKTSILNILIQLAKKGDAEKETIKGLAQLKSGVNLAMGAFAAFSGVAATAAAALNYTTREAMEAEKMQAKLSAVLKSTGNAVGMTQKSLTGLADELSRMSGIDDELIVNSEAVMLTFTQIGKQVFPEAMTAALDMNAVLGGDLQGSIIQLGKALNVTAGDTATASMGMTALRRSGVSFTEEQKKMALEMVKTGDIMGYQKLVLAELNREFGGAAEAMGDTTAGSAQKLKNSFNNLAAAVGTMFLPAIKKANEFLSENADKLTESVEAVNAFRDAYQEAAEWLGYTIEEISQGTYASEQMRQAVEALANQLQRGAAMTEFYNQQVEAQVAVQAEAEEAIKAQTEANKTFMSTLMSVQSETDTYTEKNEALRAKLVELTAEQDKVPEWSSKYADYQAQIDETKKSIEQLAAEHEMAGKRIAFSLLQQKIMAGDATSAQIQGLVDVGVNWGILDEQTADTTMRMIHNVEALGDALLEPNNQLKIANQQANQLKNKSGMMFDFFVNIHTSGSWPSLPTTMGGGGAGGPGAGAPFNARAGGGPLGNGFVLVGEQGPELITPSRYVIPADVTAALMASGLLPQYQMAFGGAIPSLDGEIIGVPYHTQTGGTTINKPKNSGGGISPPVVIQSGGGSSTAADVVAPMAAATEAAVSSAAAAQQQQVSEGIQTRSVIVQSNAAIRDGLSRIEDLLQRQEKTITRSVVAAVTQASP